MVQLCINEYVGKATIFQKIFQSAMFFIFPNKNAVFLRVFFPQSASETGKP